MPSNNTVSNILNKLAVNSSTIIVDLRIVRRKSKSCAILCISSLSAVCNFTASLNSFLGKLLGNRMKGAN